LPYSDLILPRASVPPRINNTSTELEAMVKFASSGERVVLDPVLAAS
jgi:hypothetical protein